MSSQSIDNYNSIYTNALPFYSFRISRISALDSYNLNTNFHRPEFRRPSSYVLYRSPTISISSVVLAENIKLSMLLKYILINPDFSGFLKDLTGHSEKAAIICLQC